jgi:hypothetical protein
MARFHRTSNRHLHFYSEDGFHFGFEDSSFYGGPVNLEGQPVEHPKSTNPYSYSEFVLHRLGRNSEINGSDYSDRLEQWDREKFYRLAEKHVKGYRWDNAPTKQIEEFLREFHAKPNLRLIVVMEWCSNTWPLWQFLYHV